MSATATPADARTRARYLRDVLGFSVIPIASGSKLPAGPWKAFQSRPPTDQELHRGFPVGADRAVGIVTGAVSGLVVVDADSPEALARAEEHLPPTPLQVLTSEKAPGFRGRHLYFRHPGAGTVVANRARIRLDGGKVALDVRGDGGQVLAPGSPHPDGGRYEALGEWTPEVLATLPVFQPCWLEEPRPTAPVPSRVRTESQGPSAFERARRWLEHREPAVEGQGGDAHTFATACALVRGFELHDGDALALLCEWNAGCQPPWTERELAEKVANARAYGKEAPGYLLNATPANGRVSRGVRDPNEWLQMPEREPVPGLAPNAADFNRTEMGQAEFLAALHGRDLRFSHPEKTWYAWDDRRFEPDARGAVGALALEAARLRMRQGLDLEDDMRKQELTFARECESARSRRAVLEQATHLPGIPVLPSELDADPWLLNVHGGTVDLRTGRARPHRREDLITKLAPVEFVPGATCPIWDEFLAQIMARDEDLIAYLRRAAGYILTGIIREQVLFLLHGRGGNGKSVFVQTLAALLGEDYSHRIPVEVLLESQKTGSGPTPDVADLKGRRFVYTSEADQNRRLAEGQVKALVGIDTISARRLYQNSVRFAPTHKIMFSTNHRPEVRGTDDGIWRRLHLIPFAVQIPEEKQDPALPEKLRAELPGILNWCIRGCLEWQREGLRPPAVVRAATEGYRRESDSLGEFLEDSCTLHPQAEVKAGDLWRSLCAWSEARGERAMNQKRLGQALEERGFQKYRNNGVRYRGIGLASDHGTNGRNGTPVQESSPCARVGESPMAGIPSVPSVPRTNQSWSLDEEVPL